MSIEYDNYLKDHIQNVKRAYDWLCNNNIFMVKELMTGHEDILENHDKSKYSPEEYDPYDVYFYGRNRSYKVVQDFNCAWLHHIHANPHHWQHWVLLEDDPKEGQKFIALRMPEWYVIEMICDWWSFSFAKNNLNEIFKWYAEHKNIILHEKTKALVEDILNQIRVKLNAE